MRPLAVRCLASSRRPACLVCPARLAQGMGTSYCTLMLKEKDTRFPLTELLDSTISPEPRSSPCLHDHLLSSLLGLKAVADPIISFACLSPSRVPRLLLHMKLGAQVLSEYSDTRMSRLSSGWQQVGVIPLRPAEEEPGGSADTTASVCPRAVVIMFALLVAGEDSRNTSGALQLCNVSPPSIFKQMGICEERCFCVLEHCWLESCENCVHAFYLSLFTSLTMKMPQDTAKGDVKWSN